MTLLESLLDAIIRLDGEALVMHVGEKPYVVLNSTSINKFRGPLAWGQVELSSRPLTGEAVLGMLGQILSGDQRQALEELGAIEEEIDAPGGSGQRFIVTAARGGEDVWVEVRRRPPAVPVPALVDAGVAPVAAAAAAAGSAEPPSADVRAAQSEPPAVAAEPGDGSLEHPNPVTATTSAPRDTAEADTTLARKVAALAHDAEASLADAKARLAAEAEAALSARMAALTSDAEAALAAKEAALTASAQAALAAKESDLDARAADTLTTKIAALAYEAEYALARQESPQAAHRA